VTRRRGARLTARDGLTIALVAFDSGWSASHRRVDYVLLMVVLLTVIARCLIHANPCVDGS
jgi:hypothetical protein